VSTSYQAPGVYVEWVDRSGPQLVPGRTDVAGFVGFAPRGPVGVPTKIESVQQYFSTFGAERTDVVATAYLGYAVIGFFENGGRTCWVVRAASTKGAVAARARVGLGANRTLELEATSPGAWGNEISLEPRWTGGSIDAVIARAPGRPPQLFSIDGKTLAASTTPRRAGNPFDDSLEELEPPSIARVPEDPDRSGRIVDLVNGPASIRMSGGKDGTGDLTAAQLVAGVEALERIDGISLVTVPDLMAPHPDAPTADVRRFDPGTITDCQLAILNSCYRVTDRMAVLDLPPLNDEAVVAHRNNLPRRDNMAAASAAAYHPWVAVADPLRLSGLVRFVPPSGHVAGMIARTDRLRGVHKPPANEVLEGVYDLAVAIDQDAHGRLNREGINAIRIVPGRGTLVLGARTLSDDPRWRYVNVRRLFSMIEEALDEQMQWAVFEPNNPSLWRQIDRAVRGLLERMYRAGMLDGETSDDAYLVRCDEDTNPPEVTDLGRVTCVIGLQPPYPAEFVIVRIGVTRSGIEIEEKGAQDV
jgi:phage tail sheath protein FI